MRNRGTPGRTMLEHGVQDNQQLTHTGCESQLLGLTRRQQALIEDPDDWVVAAGRQRPHVQSAANSGASTQTVRLPRRVPLSRLKGATPTRAAI